MIASPIVLPLLILSLISRSNAWKANISVKLSESAAKRGNVTDCQSSHQNPKSIKDKYLTPVALVTNFNTVSNVTVFPEQPISNLTFQVDTIQKPETSAPTYHYSLSLSSLLNLNLNLPPSLPYLITRCLHDKTKKKDITKLCKLVPSIGYHPDGFWKACKRFHPWLEEILSVTPMNESIN